jgi:three-Cys-motif partner protein
MIQPKEDGLLILDSKPHTQRKLEILTYYFKMVNTSQRDKHQHRIYIDLFAGTGKNRISSEVVLGSALSALTSPHAPTRFYFNERSSASFEALKQRVNASPHGSKVAMLHGDANDVVDSVVSDIAKNYPSALCIALLDPYGVEDLHWETVEKLAQVRRMDLFIYFSTMGIRRNMGIENYGLIDRFFGTSDWQNVRDSRRRLLELYYHQLRNVGYLIENDEIPELTQSIRNRKEAEIYTIVGASKHKLGLDFMKKAIRGASSQKQLPLSFD